MDGPYDDLAVDLQRASSPVQQIVFYATVLGCREACLVYPRPVRQLAFRAGPVTVRTMGVDLAKLPATDPLPFQTWTSNMACVAA